MVVRQSLHESINTTIYKYDIVIFDIHRTVLKISPHYWKHNEEFRDSKKKKIRENLDQYFLNDQVIKDFVQQLHQENPLFEGINSDWPAWKYYAYEPVIDRRNNLAYRIVFFLDDNNPEIIGVITVYPCE